MCSNLKSVAIGSFTILDNKKMHQTETSSAGGAEVKWEMVQKGSNLCSGIFSFLGICALHLANGTLEKK